MPKQQFLHIEVSPKDIEQAKVKDSSRCVVATAIARSIDGACRIEVDVQTVRFTVDGQRHVYVTPYAVAGYVAAFDAGEEIHPFAFRLNESTRLPMKHQKRTPAGNAIRRAQQKRTDRQAKLVELEAQTTDPTLPSPSPAVRKVARERLAAAEDDVATVTAAYADQAKTVETEGVRRPPQRVFKTGRREYGQRLLRVNGGKEAI
jgi:hypothetical protein